MKSKTRELPFKLEFPLSWIEEGTLKNIGFDRFRHDKGDIPSYLERAAQFPPFRVIPRSKLMIVHEAVPVDDIDFIVVDEESGIRYPYNIREWLRYLEDEVQLPPARSENAFVKKYNFEIPLSEVIDWVKDCKFRNFGKFQKEAHPKEAFLKELENHIPIQLANRMKPMVLEEGIHPEEIQILVIDESNGRSYPYRPRPGWVGHILGI